MSSRSRISQFPENRTVLIEKDASLKKFMGKTPGVLALSDDFGVWWEACEPGHGLSCIGGLSAFQMFKFEAPKETLLHLGEYTFEFQSELDAYHFRSILFKAVAEQSMSSCDRSTLENPINVRLKGRRMKVWTRVFEFPTRAEAETFELDVKRMIRERFSED